MRCGPGLLGGSGVLSHGHDAPYPLRRDSPGPPVRVPARVGALTAFNSQTGWIWRQAYAS